MKHKNTRNIQISVVVPVFKEELNISPFLARAIPVLEKIDRKYEVLFVLDPSPDKTEVEILKASKENHRVKLIKMSRRFGQPAATMAGLHYSTGASVVVIDVDLQDPPEVILELYSKYSQGFDVVYATRENRAGESFVKKVIARLGYKIINKLTNKNAKAYRI